MAAEFISQAGASRRLLSSLRGRPDFAQVSRNEKDRLHAMILRAKGMAAAHLAQLAEAIKQAEFAKRDEDALLDVISELAIQSSPLHSHLADPHGLARLAVVVQLVSGLVLGEHGRGQAR